MHIYIQMFINILNIIGERKREKEMQISITLH